MLERLAKTNAEIARVIKVDAEAENEWAKEKGVKGVPVFHFYNDGELVHEVMGSIPESDFQKKIEYYALSSKEREGKSGPEESIQALPKDWLPPGVSRS